MPTLKDPVVVKLSIEDRASVFLGSLADFVPRRPGVVLPPMPAKLISTSCDKAPDGSFIVTMLPSAQALAWAGKVSRDVLPESGDAFGLVVP